MFVKLSLIAVGGALGTVLRYGLHEGAAAVLGRSFGYGILAANVAGCFALGFLGTAVGERLLELRDEHHLALTVGFLGGLTTFSTFAFDTMRHAQDGRWGAAVANIALNVVLGLVAALAGYVLAMRVLGAHGGWHDEWLGLPLAIARARCPAAARPRRVLAGTRERS